MEDFVKDPPKRFVADDRIHRLSTIYFAISITSFCLTVLAILSSFLLPLLFALAYIFLALLWVLSLLLIVFSFGTILLAENHPTKYIGELMNNVSMDGTMHIAQKLIDIVPYLCYVGIGAGFVSLISAIFCKKHKKAGRIVGSIVFIALMGLILALYHIMGGVLWQEF